MSIPNPPVGQERQNHKILEQLEEEKKRLRMQQSKNSLTATSTSSVTAGPGSSGMQIVQQETQHMSTSQRAALQHAHANSVGYFITQESAFGNLILPVLPRYEK